MVLSNWIMEDTYPTKNGRYNCVHLKTHDLS